METRAHLITRIAPTPSGFLHAGNLYSFIITWLIARQEGSKILLRIDDLDAARVRTEYIDDIFRTLEFAGLDYDLGPSGTADFLANYSQSARRGLYDHALSLLREKGFASPCLCTRREIHNSGGTGCTGACSGKNISFDEPEAAWRFRTNLKEVSFRSLYCGTAAEKIPESMKDVILRRRDGIASYQLASVIDDIHYGIDLIVRGKDLLPSTIIQHAIAAALGESRFSDASFVHHRIITRRGEKLSKTQNAPSVRSEFSTRKELLTHIAAMLGVHTSVSSLDDLFASIPADTLTALTLDNVHRHRL
jgi:glutamyl-tRNA synthetase